MAQLRGHPGSSSPQLQSKVMGVTLDQLSESELTQRVFDALDEGRGGWIVTPNVDILRQCVLDPRVRKMVDSATIKTVDGAPVEWACKLAGQEPTTRIPGAAMPWLFAPEAARRDRAIMFVGGRVGAAEKASQVLQQSFPGLRASHHFPPFGFEERPTEWEALRLAILESGAAIVFVGLGFPKQERVIQQLRTDFPDVWFVGCGAAIDFTAGVVPRAPDWMQRAGLEWTYRFVIEPRRLAKRYIVHDLPFAARMAAWAIGQRGTSAERRRMAA